VPLLSRGALSRDLLLCAKNLFIAAIAAGIHQTEIDRTATDARATLGRSSGGTPVQPPWYPWPGVPPRALNYVCQKYLRVKIPKARGFGRRQQGRLRDRHALHRCPGRSRCLANFAPSPVRLARSSKCLAHLSKCSARTNRSGTRAEATNKREISQSSLVGNGGCAVSGCQSAGKRCSNHSFLGIGRRRTCRWPPRTNLWRGMTSPARGWNRPRSGERHPDTETHADTSSLQYRLSMVDFSQLKGANDV
jgi:hypothetical protein